MNKIVKLTLILFLVCAIVAGVLGGINIISFLLDTMLSALRESAHSFCPRSARYVQRATLVTANELRSTFLQYFQSKGHTIVPGSSVIPEDDPSLLFVNAGMNQFKKYYLGELVP